MVHCLVIFKKGSYEQLNESSLPSHSQQAPDYRLYKSEPELTTVTEEVDEANGEDKDKTDTAADSKETISKGTSRLT